MNGGWRMRSNQATVPVAALTTIGCVLVVLGLLAGGAVEIIVLGLVSVAVAGVLGTILAIATSRRL
jgi:fucose permease